MQGRYRRLQLSGSLFALCMTVGVLVGGVAYAAEPSTAEPGIWQSHKIRFNYLGIEPTYSCDGLQEDLNVLLRMSGARLDKPISTGPCGAGYGVPSKFLYATLNFSTLQPAGAPAEAGGSATDGPTVPGTWRHVSFAPQHPAGVLGGGDCELIQEFKDKILSAFATRNVKGNLQCAPFQTTGYFFNLSFDVFAPGGTASAGVDNR